MNGVSGFAYFYVLHLNLCGRWFCRDC